MGKFSRDEGTEKTLSSAKWGYLVKNFNVDLRCLEQVHVEVAIGLFQGPQRAHPAFAAAGAHGSGGLVVPHIPLPRSPVQRIFKGL